jgi:hypothetical protein
MGLLARRRCGIRVDIRNRTIDTLTKVHVEVVGLERRNNYDLRDIAASADTRVYLQPLTESSIIVEFTDGRGIVHAETVLGYAEAGYCGTAVATVLSQKKVEGISELGCWKSWIDFV